MSPGLFQEPHMFKLVEISKQHHVLISTNVNFFFFFFFVDKRKPRPREFMCPKSQSHDISEGN